MNKNRNMTQKMDSKYRLQQETLQEAAAQLGIVLYRPDYHAKGQDCNTVLFYSPEAAKANEELDRQEWEQGICIPESHYQMYFWCFQNTDINGRFSLDFANLGSLDLRGGLSAKEVLMAALRQAWEENNA